MKLCYFVLQYRENRQIIPPSESIQRNCIAIIRKNKNSQGNLVKNSEYHHKSCQIGQTSMVWTHLLNKKNYKVKKQKQKQIGKERETDRQRDSQD